MKATDVQIGGSHYKHFKIQPVEFITSNKLDFLQGCIIKRICRYNLPTGGGLKDLEKIKHEVDLLIEDKYGKDEVQLPNVPKPPLTRLLRDGGSGKLCPKCGSTMERINWPFPKRRYIHPECRHEFYP